MSRFIHQLPFSPLYDFKVCRTVTINGVNYTPGDMLTAEARDSLGERRLRQLYERRTISPVAPSQAQGEPDQGSQDGQVDSGGADEQPPAGGQDAGEPDQPGDAPKAVHRGFGKWFVVQPDGSEQGPMSKAEAEAMVA